MNRAAKKEYDTLHKSGDLLDMFPDFTGEWKNDKKEFIKYWESNQEVFSELDVVIEEDFDSEFN